MTIKQFIEKAIKGGWKLNTLGHEQAHIDVNLLNTGWYSDIMLDPLAWQAVGKVRLWNQWECPKCKAQYQMSGMITCPDCKHQGAREVWIVNMHRMIDALAEGKTIEEFIETL